MDLNTLNTLNTGAAWTGAVIGVVLATWEIVKWIREGPRLLLRTSSTMRFFPDSDERLILMVWVANSGTAMTTLTSFGLFTFDSWWARCRFRTGKSWIVVENVAGPLLPHELQPGQQWLGGVRQTEELAAAIAAGKLFVGVYHTGAPRRPALEPVLPSVANG